MSAGTYHMKIEQGATFSLSLTYKDTNDNPIDLTGYSARLQMRKRINDSDTVVSLTDSSGIELGGDTGTIVITISATATAALDPVEGVYDLELETGGIVTRLLSGTYEVLREVTR